MCDKLISQLALSEGHSEGHNRESSLIFHTPQNHSHRKLNEL